MTGDDIDRDELSAYVDNELPPDRRVAVEAWLARHPFEAANVMADLRLGGELRLAMAPVALPADASMSGRHRMRRLAPYGLVASVALAVGVMLGPLGLHESIAAQRPPAFVEGALSARDASELRLAMISAPESLHFDRAEIRAMTGIIIPEPPSEWTLRDVQIFPSPEGPGVEMVYDTPLHGRMSMFIVHAPEDTPAGGSLQTAALAVVWFSRNGVVYVLSGTGAAARLSQTGAALEAVLPR